MLPFGLKLVEGFGNYTTVSKSNAFPNLANNSMTAFFASNLLKHPQSFIQQHA